MKTQSDDEENAPMPIDPRKMSIKSKFNKPEDFFPYTFNIPQKTDEDRSFSSKLFYVLDEAVADLGLRKIFTFNFWFAFFFFVLAVWIRAYLHGFGSWIFLVLANVSISAFNPLLYY